MVLSVKKKCWTNCFYFVKEPDDAELSDEQETPPSDENPPGYQAKKSPQQGTSSKSEMGTSQQKQDGSTNQQFQNNHMNSSHNSQQPVVPHDQIVNQLNNQNNSQTGENPDTGEEENKTNKDWVPSDSVRGDACLVKCTKT